MENSWSIVCTSSKNKKKYNSDEILRVRPGCRLKVRLLDNPLKVVRVFTKDKKYAVVVDNEDVGNQIKQKYPDKVRNISVRFVCLCIDRDSNTLKILDMPVSVARAFGNRVAMIGKEISTVNEGCDWVILTNDKKGKYVRYDAVYIEETPLSEGEQEMVKYQMEDNDSLDLTQVFESYNFEEAEKRLLESGSTVLILS